jgi:hypothetical protein
VGKDGEPEWAYITRLQALKTMGAAGGKDWKKAMRFEAHVIGADGRDATASGSGSGKAKAKMTNWETLRSDNKVPGVTVMVESMARKLSSAFGLKEQPKKK